MNYPYLATNRDIQRYLLVTEGNLMLRIRPRRMENGGWRMSGESSGWDAVEAEEEGAK